jgi:chorismate synthase
MYINAVASERVQVLAHATQIGPFENLGVGDLSRHDVVEFLKAASNEGRSYGGKVLLQIKGLPLGLGQPVFKKFKSDLTAGLMGIGATTSVEIGEGWGATEAEGSVFHAAQNAEGYGGLRGGMTTGNPISVQIGFKPTSSVLDIAKKGRHDPCIVPRAIPVVEAMTWLVVADHWLWSQTDHI